MQQNYEESKYVFTEIHSQKIFREMYQTKQQLMIYNEILSILKMFWSKEERVNKYFFL